jgi:hypothetical protein
VKTARSWGWALLGLALLVHVGLTLPAQDAAVQAADRHHRLRRERQTAERRLADLEKRASLLASASAVAPSGASGGSEKETLQRVRSGVVRSLRDIGIDRVRLEVRPGAVPVTAIVFVQADAGFQNLLKLLAHVVRPGSGLVLERVTLGGSGPSLTLSFEAAALAGGA